MKKKENPIDGIIYIIACVLTLGGVYITRVIISEAIRKAIKDE